MEKKNNVIKYVVKWGIFAIIAVFLLFIALRKQVFGADTFLYNLYEEATAENIANKLFKVLVIVLGGVDIIYIANVAIKIGTLVKNNTAKTTFLLIGNVLKYISAILIVLISLSAMGVDSTALVTGAGVLTLVISLGCQTLVSDIVAGIFLLFEGDIKVGDIVVINGWRGTVQQIGLRRTKIEDTVGNINIVNNSSISNIINNTRDLSIAICYVGIEYNESIERVENILKENFETIKKNLPSIVAGPFYQGVSELGASSVNIKIVAKCREENKFQLERDLNREIKLLFDKHNVNIPFNQIVLNYRDENEEAAKSTAKEAETAKAFIKEQKELTRGIDEQNQ